MDLPIAGEAVPVFDCHVLLRQTEKGVTARTANVDGITSSGPTERDALLAMVKKFKAFAQACTDEGKPIPFLAEPIKPESDEVERWVPVHL